MWNETVRETYTHLSFWPIVLLKNIIIHFCGTVGHKHYSLAAHAAPSSSIKLHKVKDKNKNMSLGNK